MALHTLDQIRTDDLTTHAREELDPLQILGEIGKILKRKRWFIFGFSLGCAFLVGLVGFLTKPTFTAVCSFIPPTGSSSSGVAAALAGQLSSMGGGAGSLLGGGKTSGDLYVGILKSRVISEALIHRFDLVKIYNVPKESLAEKRLAANTEFVIGAKDGIVKISVTDHDPARARDLANAYLDALRATSGGLALTENSQRRQFFEQRLALEKDELANAEVALKQAQEKTGLIAPAGQTQIELSAIAQLRSQIASAEVRLATLRSDESDDNVDIQRVQHQLASLRSQVNQMENGKGGGNAGALSTAQVPALQLEYVRRAREVKYHETLFEILAKQYETARLDEAHDATLQILDRATIPDTKSGPHRAMYILTGFLAGLLISTAWTCFRSLTGFNKSQPSVV